MLRKSTLDALTVDDDNDQQLFRTYQLFHDGFEKVKYIEMTEPIYKRSTVESAKEIQKEFLKSFAVDLFEFAIARAAEHLLFHNGLEDVQKLPENFILKEEEVIQIFKERMSERKLLQIEEEHQFNLKLSTSSTQIRNLELSCCQRI